MIFVLMGGKMRKEVLEKIINSKRNNIISGEMSTGKTTNVGFGIVKKLIERNENLFILDTKEEYIKKYYNVLKNNGYNIIIVNTKNPNNSVGWNPLEYSRKLFKDGLVDDSIRYLNSVAEELFFVPTDIDTFWSNMANNLFKGMALSLFKDAKDDEINLRSIYTLIMDASIDSNYLEEYFRTKSKDDPIYICGAPVVFSPRDTRGGIISTAMSKLNPIVRDNNLSYLLNNTTYSYDSLLKSKTAIFYVASELGDINCLASVYVKELFNILCDNNNKNKFNIILDNFDYIGNLIDFNKMLSICIRSNIKFYIFTRDKDSLENSYSKYINKLANNIVMDDSRISYFVGSELIEMPNKEIKDNYDSLQVEYPSLNKIEAKVFNLKKYVIDNIRVDRSDCENYALELGNIDSYNRIVKYNDAFERDSVLNNDAKFYIVKDDDKIIDSFVIYNDDNLISLDNKKLLDIDYLNFIFDNLKGYDYIMVCISKDSDYILNTLKFNFDIDSINEVDNKVNIKINI